MVFIHLYQHWPRVNYYLTKSGRKEVDFLATDNSGKPSVAIQVCLDIQHPDILKHELEPLVKTAKYFNIKENLILTYNHYQSFKEQGVSIQAIPVWKWMM